MADSTLAEIKERMRAITMLVPDGFARDCLDALAYAERIAQERDEWRSRAQDAENAAAATRQECDGMLARWGTAIQALGEHASPGLDLGECVFAVVARLSAASDRIAALESKLSAAEREREELRVEVAALHSRLHGATAACDELRASRDAAQAALRRIAYEPFGPPEATHREVLDAVTEHARAALSAPAADAKHEAGGE